MRNTTSEDSRIWYIIGALGLLIGLAMRLKLASAWETPGHGDSAFYFTVAKNIADGRGIVVDYVVYFFQGLVPLTRYAGDFWNPLAEILLSLPMLVLGKSLFNALLASIAAGTVTALAAFFAGRRFSGSTRFGILAALLSYFTPFLIVESVRTEAIIFFGAFGSTALFLAARGRRASRSFVLAAMCTGLAHFVRQDGVLLLLTLLACVALAPIPWRNRLAWAAAVLVVHAAMLSPLLIKNYLAYGSLLQPGPARTAFMTSYEDFHAYGKEMNWDTLRAEWGLRRIITRRLHTAGENLAQVKGFMDPLLLLLASLGAVNILLVRRYRDLHVLVPPAIYWALAFAFYSAIASFSGPGSLPKSLAVLMPFACLLIVDLVASRTRSGILLGAVILSMAAYFGHGGYRGSYGSALYWNEIYSHYEPVRELVTADASARGIRPEEAVLMARDVWDVYEATGFRTVMIPNNDLETILFVARHYGVEYMLMPAPRQALEDIYLGHTPDSRFRLLGGIPGTDWKVFRIEASPP